MRSITIDILNSKAFNLLKDLELLELIRLHKERGEDATPINWTAKYKGAMSKQPVSDIDTQLSKLRGEWE